MMTMTIMMTTSLFFFVKIYQTHGDDDSLKDRLPTWDQRAGEPCRDWHWMSKVFFCINFDLPWSSKVLSLPIVSVPLILLRYLFCHLSSFVPPHFWHFYMFAPVFVILVLTSLSTDVHCPGAAIQSLMQRSWWLPEGFVLILQPTYTNNQHQIVMVASIIYCIISSSISNPQNWHKRCFNCANCNRLDSTTVNDGPDGEIYCRGCHRYKFSYDDPHFDSW